ncbi:MAG: hypothetical protein J0I06_05305 [Planctomycetes bacterium]|nr:hypothetical protein [Planctomycetota bacterium]
MFGARAVGVPNYPAERVGDSEVEKVSLEVRASRFGSPVDGFLTVYDADRKVVGRRHRRPGVTLPRDGTHSVALIDAHDLGGANFGYRLTVKKDK